MAESDLELLQRYARQGSQEAFAEVVRRHLDLVYSVALRQVRSPQLAEDVAQSVFLDLARSAGRMNGIVAAWLYKVARRTAIDTVRKESRRQAREAEAAAGWTEDTAPAWARIEPLLDEAMESLAETDRSTILLRYFENRSLREVGCALGTTEDAAQKRVSRALEKLRNFFSRRGVATGAGGLAAALSTNAVQSAPAALGGAILAAAPAGGAVVSAVAWTTVQKTAVAAILAASAVTAVYQARRAEHLQGDIRATTADRQSISREGDSLRRQNERLRGEIAGLKSRTPAQQAPDPARSEILAWLTRRDRLWQRLQQSPELGVPEMRALTDQDWLDVARRAKTDDEEGALWALSSLRGIAEYRFAGRINVALRKYLAASGGVFPTDVMALTPFFDVPADAAALQRWQVIPTKDRGRPYTNFGEWCVTQRTVVDPARDSRFTVSGKAAGTNAFCLGNEFFTNAADVFNPMARAFREANGGPLSLDPAELRPYAKSAEEHAVLEEWIRRETARKTYDREHWP